MKSFQEERYWKNIFGSRIVTYTLFVIVLYLGFKVGVLFAVIFKEEQQLQALREEMRLLQQRKERATVKIEGLESGTVLEKEARSNFNIKRPGEQTVVIVDPREADEVSEQVDSAFSRIKSWFGFE